MKARMLTQSLVLAGCMTLGASGAYASGLIPYWSLSDLTSGADGTANFNISFDMDYYDGVTFGIFNNDGGAIGTQADIFMGNDTLGVGADANFMWNGSDYDVTITVEDGLGNQIRQTAFNDFGTTFGFYFLVDDYYGQAGIYSDSMFDFNVGGYSMMMNPDLFNDTVNVQLWKDYSYYYDNGYDNGYYGYGPEPIYAVNVVDVAPIPEPATMLLFGTGLAGLAGLRRKMKK